MNLAIDIGNTWVKFGVFASGELQHKESCVIETFNPSLSHLSKSFPFIKKAIVSSVGNLASHQIKKLEEKYPILILDHSVKLPFINKYGSPKTLGVDRIALVSAASKSYDGKNVLIVDAGTCITYDFINANNEYLGGAISPGIQMRYKSLNKYTANLPLLNPEQPEAYIGDDTENSIHVGILRGAQQEIDGFIDTYKGDFENLTVILTGGDAQFLRGSIKNDIFANPNFLLEGLSHILEYNTF